MRLALMLACGVAAGVTCAAAAGVTVAAAAGVTVAAAAGVIVAAAQDADEIKRGEALLTRHCAGCHAVGRTGASTHAEAPPFRTLGKKYPIEALEEALGEGIVSGHPDMPEFKFSAPDVGAIVEYLNSIQEK